METVSVRLMMMAVYAENGLNILFGKTDKRLFDKGALVFVQIFGDEGVRNTDNELVILVA